MSRLTPRGRWAAVCAVIVVVAGGAATSHAATGSGGGHVSTACVAALFGVGGSSATPIAHSADPEVVSQLAILRAARTAADVLPSSAGAGRALAVAGAVSYDPSAAVLESGSSSRGGTYVVPASLSRSRVTRACGAAVAGGDGAAYLAAEDAEIGTGPGACLLTTRREVTQSGTSGLPGAPTTRALKVSGAQCSSLAVLHGHGGALGDASGQSTPTIPALIPDGVSQVTYTLPDGRAFTVPVSGNLATPPAQLALDEPLNHPSDAVLARLIAAHLPVSVAETGANGAAIATFTPPPTLVSDEVGSRRFLQAALESGVSAGGGSTAQTTASCSARTHRCVAAVVTLACDPDRRCEMTRRIDRYRYVGATPPPGTTGPDTQDTAPIVGRTARLISHPGRLSLLLRGRARRRVTVLLAVACASRGESASVSQPPLEVAVPSRTSIPLPGAASSFGSCEVGALATSQDGSPVRLGVVRG